MLNLANKIVFTGGSGRFGTIFKKKNKNSKIKIFFPTSKQLNILNVSSIRRYLKIKKPKFVIHAAGLSRPMSIHETNIAKSIDLNIIGTANLTKICSELKIKIIYLSTSYVYPGERNNYKEDSPLKPINNYGLSKLGGEASVGMYENSLILRLSMTEKPFVHKSAFTDFITNFIFHDEVASLLLKLINQKGIINIGGKSQSVYKFAKNFNKYIKKKSAKKVLGKNAKINLGMNINKMKKIVKL